MAKTRTCLPDTAGLISITEILPVSEAIRMSSIWLHPASEDIQFNLTLCESKTISCNIYDLGGKRVERYRERYFPAGDHQEELNVTKLAKGA